LWPLLTVEAVARVTVSQLAVADYFAGLAHSAAQVVGSSIIGMIEVIESDFGKSLANTERGGVQDKSCCRLGQSSNRACLGLG